MDLKCTLIRNDSRKNMLFLISPQEESRLFTCLGDHRGDPELLLSVPLVGDTKEISDHDIVEIRILLDGLDALVLTSEATQSLKLAELVCDARLRGVRVINFTSALLELDPRIPSEHSTLFQFMSLSQGGQGATQRAYAVLKTLMEPVAAAALLIFLSPLLLIVALAVRLTSSGPILYRQTRTGHRHQTFNFIKFRSMRVDAEKNGPVWASASKSDSRLTPIGGFLRATHIDELPQIWNVVCGELSFIGPRPERPVFCKALEAEIPMFRLRTLIKPGITGWAQIRAGYANSINDSQRKLEFDLYYIFNHSLTLDLKIILGTLALLVSGGSEGRKRKNSTTTPKTRRQRLVTTAMARRSTVPALEANSASDLEFG